MNRALAQVIARARRGTVRVARKNKAGQWDWSPPRQKNDTFIVVLPSGTVIDKLSDRALP
jgi:hypothetical protein